MSHPADLLIRAATIHTLDADRPHAAAVAVRDGVVVGIGDRPDALDDLRGGRTTVLDLGDGALTPGLIDGHLHPVHGLGTTVGPDLSAVRNVDDLIAALRGARPVDGWVRAYGLDPNAFAGGSITAAPLVAALGPDLPVYVVLYDAHSALVSPAGLRAAGITGPRAFASNASIVCDADGAPTGHVIEFEAMAVVEAAIPPEPAADRRGRLRTLLRSMAAAGLTAGNVMDFGDDSGDLLRALDADGDLPLRLRMHPWCEPGVGRDGLEHLVELQREGGRRWRVAGVKLFLDGTIEGGTAWLESADSRGECTAPNWREPGDYRDAVAFLSARGVPTATHAIGDAGVRYALAALGAAQASGTAALRVPHRIEHIESIPSELVGEFARLGVVASMQPTHCTHFVSADGSDEWSTRLGAERAARAFRTRDIRDQGGTLALGSDWPVAPFDPRAILADAQLRRRAGHPEDDPRHPEQGLTALMALQGYTSHAAAAQGETGTTGLIAVGARADFTAFALDPLQAPPDELADAPILATVVDGAATHLDPAVG